MLFVLADGNRCFLVTQKSRNFVELDLQHVADIAPEMNIRKSNFISELEAQCILHFDKSNSHPPPEKDEKESTMFQTSEF